MQAEIISIGTELLLGHIVNTNTAFLSQKLAENGIDVYHTSVVGDNPSRLMQSLKLALGRADVIITTGGLGPTVDDITTETIANFLGRKLILNRAILNGLKRYFISRKVRYPKDNIRQALIPEGTKWIPNRTGTAPGLLTEYNGKVIICLPGPPRELGPMFENDIMPYLKKRAGTSQKILSRTIKLMGLPESRVNGIAKDLLLLKPPVTVGIYAKLGEVDLRIMAKIADKNAADREIKRVENKIKARLKDYIFGYDDDTMEGSVGKALAARKKTIAIAESCTGGLVSSRLTDVSGSSKYFMMGITAYSNDIKERILGVSRKLIRQRGAVSKEVAIEMARGARFLACTDIGIGITGIAGPDGGTRSKPVGLVYIALATAKKSIVKECRFKGSREEIKFQASQAALDLARKNI